MNGFKPFKRHANEFKYTPRFYDPEKEAREQRRAELRGSRPEGAEGDYVAGEYLRRQREAREARRGSKRRSGGGRSTWFMVMGIVLIFLLGYMMLPRLIDAFVSGGTDAEKYRPVDEYEEFDPYAPIRIVPNE